MASFKKKNLLVILYALIIIALGVVFLSQGSKLGASSSKKVNITVKNEQTGVKETKQVPISEVKEPVYSYEVVSQNKNVKLNLGQTTNITLKIRNTGNVTLYQSGTNPLYLAASHPIDRKTIFYQEKAKGWLSANRIVMGSKELKPGATASFTFQVKAPNKSGIYREFFTPVLEKIRWLEDKNIYWDITVRDPAKPDEELKITVDGQPSKYIKINLTKQMLYAYEDGLVKYEFQTSTGLPGMDTPTGEFAIVNKFPVQYSAQYELFMDNWMAFTPSGAYGIHSLPYWKLKNGGRLYEGEAHLGTKVSHGCVRTSLENSKLLYDWAEVKMPVYIEN